MNDGLNDDIDYAVAATRSVTASSAPPPDQALARELLRVAGELGIARDGASIDDVLVVESLQAVELRAAVARDLRRSLALEPLLRGVSTRELAGAAEPVESARSAPVVVHDAAGRFDPFPLTPVQGAYLLGRTDAVPLGGRSAHYYVELDVDDVETDQLELGLRAVVERHDTLRAVVRPDGTQQVLPEVPPWQLSVEQLEGADEPERTRRLGLTRAELVAQSFDPARWPLFDVRASRLSADRVRLHVSCDLLLLDARSVALFIGEWLTAATLPQALAAAPAITFRDLVLARRDDPLRQAAHRRARDHWRARLDALPPAPSLPRAGGQVPSAPEFTRRATRLGRRQLSALRSRARSLGVTPTVLLAAAYVETLAGWSAEPEFTLNVTLSERPPDVPDADRVLGDFTSSLPLVCRDVPGGVAERAVAMQAQLARDLEHDTFSGVEVQRELAIRHGADRAALPVVFTSLLSESEALGPSVRLFAHEVFSRSQTPHVTLDNQVVQLDGELTAIWDAAEEVFPAGMLDDAFAVYERLLRELCDDGPLPPQTRRAFLSPRTAAVRALCNSTAAPLSGDLLHDGFTRQARRAPAAIAVATSEREFSYSRLDELSAGVAAWVRAVCATPGERVAIVMRKGWEQVAAVLGTSRAGAAYLPIDASLPAARVARLIAEGGSTAALVQPGGERHPALAGLPILVVDERAASMPRDGAVPREPVAPSELAYVIFTSGSTGTPKGVAVEHGAAVNTVEDVNRRWRVDAKDAVLALSSLSFDLSVYDVFGVLAAGGTVVVPDDERAREPAHWLALGRARGLTVWNSVPQLFELLVEHCERRSERLPDSLRLALLSGDWIPVPLADRARSRSAGLRDVISLGGATEAAIWSIQYPVESVDPGWASVPYGFPLANQSLHVLDRSMRDRPDHAVGELYIGGRGLARGYLGRPELTAARFVRVGDSGGERLYRTGDYGRYRPDGAIEFLGRRDDQVKVGGHRVELGEIESALTDLPQLRVALVTAARNAVGGRRLVAYCVPSGETAPEASALQAALERVLPAYMVPRCYVLLPGGLPLTANGKIDRAALPAPPHEPDGAEALAAPRGAAERTVAATWCAVLGRDEVGREVNFFELGGDSLLAIRALARLSDAGIRLTPAQFFAAPTVAAQAKLAGAAPAPSCTSALVGAVELTPSQQWFFEQQFAAPDHWNGMWPLFELREPLDAALLQEALDAVVRQHESLRLTFETAANGAVTGCVAPAAGATAPVTVVDLSDIPPGSFAGACEEAVAAAHASLDLAHGPTLRLTLLRGGRNRPDHLVFSVHWLVMDYYSSRVFYQDLRTAYAQRVAGEPARLAAPGVRIDTAVQQLRAFAAETVDEAEVAVWRDLAATRVPPLPAGSGGSNLQRDAGREQTTVDALTTAALAELSVAGRRAELREVLIAAVAAALARWTAHDTVLLELEGHGRDRPFADLDMSRTVGRFSTISPLLLRPPRQPISADETLAATVEQLRSIPGRGVGFGALRHFHPDARVRKELAAAQRPPVGFNFWGDVTEYFSDELRPVALAFGPHRSPVGERSHELDVVAFASGGQLTLALLHTKTRHSQATARTLLEGIVAELRAFAGTEQEAVR